jgi:hypothetical protein
MAEKLKQKPKPETIRDLPWFREEDLARLPRVNGVLLLPDLAEVLEVAEEVFASARAVEGDQWSKNGGFLAREDIKNFLRALMTAYQRLKENASHTSVWCEWKDAVGAVCGSKMDIAVDAFGAYYRCQLDPATHRTPK